MDTRTEEYSTIKLIERTAFSLFPLSGAENIFCLISVEDEMDPVEYLAYVAWIGPTAPTAHQPPGIDPVRMSPAFTDRTRKGVLDKLLDHLERQAKFTYGRPPVFPGSASSTAQNEVPNPGASQNGANPVQNGMSSTQNGASTTALPHIGDNSSPDSQNRGPD